MKSRMIAGLLILLTVSAGWGQQLMTSHAPSQSQTAANPSTRDLSKPVARVNGSVLTQGDLLREEYTIFPYARQHNGQIPASMEASIRDGAIKMIVFEELVYQEALRRKMVVPAAKLARAKADFRSRFKTPAEYTVFLNSELNGSEKALTEKIQRSMLIDTLLKQEVGTKSVISPAELRAYYNSNAKRFEYPESFLIQTISFIPPQNATSQQLAEARKKAESALPQAKASKTAEQFGLLAEKVSEDDYHVMMGQHKPMDRTSIVPAILEKLLKMKAGDVTDIIQIGQIYTIIRLNKHITPGRRKFEEVKADLKKELEEKKVNRMRAALDKKLRQNARIEVL